MLYLSDCKLHSFSSQDDHGNVKQTQHKNAKHLKPNEIERPFTNDKGTFTTRFLTNKPVITAQNAVQKRYDKNTSISDQDHI
jgi:hypothetical protein